jgi:oxysterol-binding protein-related protein 3/6/7
MNLYALQLNSLSEKLKAKLPPTDSRFRADTRYWENADLELAQENLVRLQDNQRARREKLKQMLKDHGFGVVDMYDERVFYTPRFFTKESNINALTGKIDYIYKPIDNGNKYWNMREKGDWSELPKIFDDDCEPFGYEDFIESKSANK